MAGKKGYYRSSGFSIPIAPIAGLLVGMAEPADALMKGDFMQALACMDRYIGYNVRTKTLNLDALKVGLVPLIIGCLVHKFVGGRPLNLNRALKGLPIKI